MEQKMKKTTARVGVELIEGIKAPEPGAWHDLARDLKLDAPQTNELKRTVRLVVEDIESFRSIKTKQSARGELVSRLKLMEKALGSLQHEVHRSPDLMRDFLPHDTMMHIGRSFTFSATGEALGKQVYPQSLDFFIESSRVDGKQLTMENLEKQSRPQREALGLQHGHQILKHFIDTIHAPLKKWIELDTLNKGGRPPQVARTCLIYRLAEAAPNIIGKPAPISATGSFVTLCSLVLPACGLSAKGVEKAIPAIVRRVRSHQAKLSGGS